MAYAYKPSFNPLPHRDAFQRFCKHSRPRSDSSFNLINIKGKSNMVLLGFDYIPKYTLPKFQLNATDMIKERQSCL